MSISFPKNKAASPNPFFPNSLQAFNQNEQSADYAASKAEKIATCAKSKFWGNSSSDSSGDSSSFDSPIAEKKTIHTHTKSPLAAFGDLLQEAEPEFDLMRKETEVMTAALKHIADLPQKEKDESAKNALKSLFKKMAGGTQTPPMNSPSTHRKLSDSLLNSSWTAGIVNDLRRSISSESSNSEQLLSLIANMKHIVEGDGAGGCHFCPPDSEKSKELENIKINPSNGVFCATFKTDKKLKFSSFYPSTINSQKELLEIVTQSIEVARQGDRSLRDTGKGFFIEAYLKKEGLIFHSAFPIFFYAKYSEDSQYTITDGFKLASAAVLKIAEDLVKQVKGSDKEPAIRYFLDGGNSVIVDIAPALAIELEIAHGIYFLFPSSCFQGDIQGDI
jgi:hypothetical protein